MVYRALDRMSAFRLHKVSLLSAACMLSKPDTQIQGESFADSPQPLAQETFCNRNGRPGV